MKNPAKKASLANIARHAGVSTAAASFALNNQPGVSPKTREKILRIAKELAYTPDARIGDWMARVRDAKSKDLLPVAWLNTAREKDAWQSYPFQSPCLEGARSRALELGYKLEEFWTHERGLTMECLSKTLYQRGIEGVIVTHPARHFRLSWDHLAGVAFGASLLAPSLHRITSDLSFNLLLAWRSLKKLGYKRIGIGLALELDSASHYTLRAMARDLCSSAACEDYIPPLFHAHDARDERTRPKEMIAWVKRYKPEVIVGHDNRLEQWLRMAGYRVPEDVGLALLAVDDDVLDWAGIHSRRREMGATTIEWLISLIRNRQFGVPKTPLNILIRGTWQNGRTLRTPPKLTSARAESAQVT